VTLATFDETANGQLILERLVLPARAAVNLFARVVITYSNGLTLTTQNIDNNANNTLTETMDALADLLADGQRVQKIQLQVVNNTGARATANFAVRSAFQVRAYGTPAATGVITSP
jgi:hypothetical protein